MSVILAFCHSTQSSKKRHKTATNLLLITEFYFKKLCKCRNIFQLQLLHITCKDIQHFLYFLHKWDPWLLFFPDNHKTKGRISAVKVPKLRANFAILSKLNYIQIKSH